MLPTRSAAFEAFVQPALDRPEIWRTVLAGLLIVAIWFTSAFLVAGSVFVAMYLWFRDAYVVALTVFDNQETPGAVAFFLSTYFGFILALLIVINLLNKRPFASVFGPSRRILWRHYVSGAAVVFLLAGLSSLPSVFTNPPLANLPLGTWLSWLPLTIVLLVVQTGSEELFFRGFLQQQLAARFKSRWMWWFLPSALFGVMHYNPATFGDNTWLVIVTATILGLILADVTARSGNLSIALGMHFANNFVAIALVGTPGQLSGLSLYLSRLDLSNTDAVRAGLLTQIALLSIMYLLYLLFAARRMPQDPAEAVPVDEVFS